MDRAESVGAAWPPGFVAIDDPDAVRAESVRSALSTRGLIVHRLGAEASSFLEANSPSVVVFALGPAPSRRDEILERHVARGLTVLGYGEGVGRWSVARRATVLLRGAADLLDRAERSFEDQLAGAVTRLQETRAEDQRVAGAVAALMRELGLVGSDPTMLSVFSWILRCRELSDLSVLIRGETGTGKELVARALHRLDPKRSERPFVALNCAALTPTLAEAELFGHRRGAFTGAVRDRPGLVRAAAGGVLFLDEVCELDPIVQGKLLRVLEEGRVLTLGEDVERPVDVRVVAATHRDPESMVADGTFREDLLYRLGTLSVTLPPLRERRSDIPVLVDWFLADHARASGQPVASAARDFVEALARLKLPGNVRQLRNLLAESVLRRRGPGALRLRDLPVAALQELAQAPAGRGGEGPTVTTQQDGRTALLRIFEREEWRLDSCLDECERILVQEALGRADGNRSGAARILGVSPRTVYTKMRKHKLGA